MNTQTEITPSTATFTPDCYVRMGGSTERYVAARRTKQNSQWVEATTASGVTFKFNINKENPGADNLRERGYQGAYYSTLVMDMVKVQQRMESMEVARARQKRITQAFETINNFKPAHSNGYGVVFVNDEQLAALELCAAVLIKKDEEVA